MRCSTPLPRCSPSRSSSCPPGTRVSSLLCTPGDISILRRHDRKPRADCHCGELIDHIAAGTPVGKLLRVDCGQIDPATVIRPVLGKWQPHLPEHLDGQYDCVVCRGWVVWLLWWGEGHRNQSYGYL